MKKTQAGTPEAQEQKVGDDNKRRIGLTPISVIAVVIGAYFLAQILAGIVLGAVGSIAGFRESELIDQFDEPIWQFGFVVLFEAFTLGILYWFMKFRSVSWRDIGLGRGPLSGDFGIAFVIFGIYFVTLITVTALINALVPIIDTQQKQQITFESASGTTELLMAFVALVIIVPIVEEIMVRGVLYSGLRTQFRKITAALLASFIFGIAHLQLETSAPPLWIAAIDTFILSMFLIWLREKTGSLWAGIGVHSIKNGLAFIALFIFV